MKLESHLLDSSTDSDKHAGSALSRGVQILQAFNVRQPELSAKALMEATGLPKATFFRLANTLCAAGLLRYSEQTSRFGIAAGLLSIASNLIDRVSVRQLAFAQMQMLADHAKGQVALGLGSGLDLVYVELAQAAVCASYRPALGSRISLSRTATGRAYLCALAPEAAQQHVEAVTAADAQAGALLKERLLEARQSIAERGFCESHGDLQRQLEAVAVSLRSAQSDEIYVFNCVVPAFNLAPNQLRDDIGPRLVTLARSIEAALGHTPETSNQWA